MSRLLIIAGVLFAVMLYLGLRYPRGWRDWPHDVPRTLRIIVLVLVFVAMLAILWAASTYLAWPPALEIMAWVAGITIGVLVLLGMVWPRGVGFPGKK